MSAAPADWLGDATVRPHWDRLDVVVTGIGVAGFAAADALVQLGARVCVLDDADGEQQREKATILQILGADVRLGAGATTELPARCDLVVTSPGVRPTNPALVAAAARGVPVWGDVELAYRLRDPDQAAPWLCVTGTNGKTTTVRMLASMLSAAGLRAVAAGNIGTPLLEVVLHPQPYDVLAVELSSFQLHWTHSMSAESAVVLNLADDHTDWHGSSAAYRQDKGKIYARCRIACVYNAEDAATRQLVEAAEVTDGCRAIGFTLGVPSVGMLGVVDGVLADRAFVAGRRTMAAELGAVDDVAPAAPHNVANALAAAALARAHGVAPAAVRAGLRQFTPEPHRITDVAVVSGVRFVDDSKATNPHAAQASLTAYPRVVWIAGGLAKGAAFDDLVRTARPRLRGAVLLGADRAAVAAALTRHAPDVPVIDIAATDTGAMEAVVRAAAALAHPGDTVLLAPACASMDMFSDYAARGAAFADAVRRLAGD